MARSPAERRSAASGDILSGLRTPQRFSTVTRQLEDGGRRAATVARLKCRGPLSVASFQGSDPLARMCWRGLASTRFRPGRVHAYEPIFRRTVGESIDHLFAQTSDIQLDPRRCDRVDSLAFHGSDRFDVRITL